jgi:hypothetical protein
METTKYVEKTAKMELNRNILGFNAFKTSSIQTKNSTEAITESA